MHGAAKKMTMGEKAALDRSLRTAMITTLAIIGVALLYFGSVFLIAR